MPPFAVACVRGQDGSAASRRKKLMTGTIDPTLHVARAGDRAFVVSARPELTDLRGTWWWVRVDDAWYRMARRGPTEVASFANAEAPNQPPLTRRSSSRKRRSGSSSTARTRSGFRSIATTRPSAFLPGSAPRSPPKGSPGRSLLRPHRDRIRARRAWRWIARGVVTLPPHRSAGSVRIIVAPSPFAGKKPMCVSPPVVLAIANALTMLI